MRCLSPLFDIALVFLRLTAFHVAQMLMCRSDVGCFADDVVVDRIVVRLYVLVEEARSDSYHLDDNDESPEIDCAVEDRDEVVEGVRESRVDCNPDLNSKKVSVCITKMHYKAVLT